MNKQVQFIPFLNQIYEDIQKECLVNKCLFIDKKFPHNKNDKKTNLIWKRPYDVTDNPKFFINTPHRRDPSQGELSDCWFIVAVANLTFHQQIFQRVVPLNQTFDKENGYTGLFHFHFWQFGIWYDVIIDDYLPFNKKTGQPWCSWNRHEPDEFWVALIEKAYAKLNGGYQNLNGGAPIEAFTDLTAGVEQRFKLNDTIKDRKEFFNFINDSLKHLCLMACSINPKSDGSNLEEIQSNGLVVGHSYSITAARYLQLNDELLPMIRLRNPWANEIEWAGAWHDKDHQWNYIDLHEKRRMSWENSDDGEFWMNFEDFFNQFDILEICHLSPDTFEEELHLVPNSYEDHRTSISIDNDPIQPKTWSCLSFEGQWIKNLSSGGRCITTCEHGCNFWKNPQYKIEINGENQSAIVISLMQKYNRLKSIENPVDRYDYIQARIYKIYSDQMEKQTYENNDLEYIGYTGSYINRREVTVYLRVSPGKYLIIPSLYEPNKTGHFLLRIFLETNNSTPNLHEQLTRLSFTTPVNASFIKTNPLNPYCCCCCPSFDRNNKIHIFHSN